MAGIEIAQLLVAGFGLGIALCFAADGDYFLSATNASIAALSITMFFN